VAAAYDIIIGMKARSMLLCAALAATGLAQGAGKKLIYTSWEFDAATPAQVLEMADAFDKTAYDGVAINVAVAACNRRPISDDPGWKYSDVEKFEADLRQIVKHRSLRESLVFLATAPQKRLAWTDDRAWAAFANNMGVFARLAKRSNMKGLLTDFEDYYKQGQYNLKPSDNMTYAEACKLARRRGSEIFAPVFREYPDITILMYQLLTENREYGSSDDPVAIMKEKLDLWPAVVNGMFDVMPDTAKIVDGNEGFGYTGQAARGDFYFSTAAQLVRVLPMIARENRAKYRSQVSVSFGLYVDGYCYFTNSASSWYLGPVRGKRINHFEDNLRQAMSCADEYVWLWAEHGYAVDWPKRTLDFGPKFKRWNELMDGNLDLVCRGVKDPDGLVSELYAQKKADGTYVELATKPTPDEHGHVYHGISPVYVSGWYGLRVRGRGKATHGWVYFRHNGEMRYKCGNVRFRFGAPDPEGWRTGQVLVSVPEGASELFVILNGRYGDENLDAEYKDLECFRIK